MALTNSQKKSLKTVVEYLFHEEQTHFLNELEDKGYSSDEIERFISMSFGGKLMFMQAEKLTYHVYYHLLNLQTI